ncbi:MAG: hypothetical protein U0163_09715 [Gemmatimonadaceae bacterium]
MKPPPVNGGGVGVREWEWKRGGQLQLGTRHATGRANGRDTGESGRLVELVK